MFFQTSDFLYEKIPITAETVGLLVRNGVTNHIPSPSVTTVYLLGRCIEYASKMQYQFFFHFLDRQYKVGITGINTFTNYNLAEACLDLLIYIAKEKELKNRNTYTCIGEINGEKVFKKFI